MQKRLLPFGRVKRDGQPHHTDGASHLVGLRDVAEDSVGTTLYLLPSTGDRRGHPVKRRRSPIRGFLDNAAIGIACPQCGHKRKERLGWLSNNPVLRCTRCGTNIQIDAKGKGGLAQGLKSVDKGLADLQRSLKKLGK